MVDSGWLAGMRSNLLWPLAVIVALVVGYLWQGSAPPAKPEKRRSARTVAPKIAALEARIDALESEIETLKTARDEAADAPEIAVARPVGTAPRRRVDDTEPAPAAGAADPDAVAEAIAANDPKVRNQLRRLIAKEREAEREVRRERRMERAAERTRQMVADLADQADLDDDQQTLIQTRLDEERTMIMGLFRTAHEDGSFPEARREAEAVRDATDAQIKAKLSEAQYQRYEELREENSWRGRRGRR